MYNVSTSSCDTRPLQQSSPDSDAHDGQWFFLAWLPNLDVGAQTNMYFRQGQFFFGPWAWCGGMMPLIMHKAAWYEILWFDSEHLVNVSKLKTTPLWFLCAAFYNIHQRGQITKKTLASISRSPLRRQKAATSFFAGTILLRVGCLLPVLIFLVSSDICDTQPRGQYVHEFSGGPDSVSLTKDIPRFDGSSGGYKGGMSMVWHGDSSLQLRYWNVSNYSTDRSSLCKKGGEPWFLPCFEHFPTISILKEMVWPTSHFESFHSTHHSDYSVVNIASKCLEIVVGHQLTTSNGWCWLQHQSRLKRFQMARPVRSKRCTTSVFLLLSFSFERLHM